MIEKMLAGAGYEVVTARDGLEAIEKAVLEDVRLFVFRLMGHVGVVADEVRDRRARRAQPWLPPSLTGHEC